MCSEDKMMMYLQKTQIFSSFLGRKNDQTSSALLRHLLPAGPTCAIWFIWRRARGLGMAPCLYMVPCHCTDPESDLELVR